MTGIRFRNMKVEIIAAGAAFFILCCILLPRPITGVADNGDFARIMNSTGLRYLSENSDDRYFGYVNRLYETGLGIPFGGGYLSTELPLVLLAVRISKAVTGTTFFDIRFLAAIYILILTSAVYLLVKYRRRASVTAALFSGVLAVLIFCDTGYTAYFNSLYGEPVTFVFLLLMTAAAFALSAAEKQALWLPVLFCAGLLFFAGAKVQNAPAGLLTALFCLRLAKLDKRTAWRRISLISAVSVAVVSLLCFYSISKEIKVCNKYQTVFYGILKGSSDPAGDLAELGMDPSLAVLAGTHYFMDSYPVNIRTDAFKAMLMEKVGYGNVAGFYLRHPGRLLQKLEYAAENGFKLKQGFGNYEKYPGIRYKQTSNVFSFWSNFKQNALPHTLWFVCSFYLLAVTVLAYEYRRTVHAGTRFFIEFMGIILLTGSMQFVLPVIGDGEADLSKHLFLFNLSFDLLFMTGAVYLAQKASVAIKHLRNRRLAAGLRTE